MGNTSSKTLKQLLLLISVFTLGIISLVILHLFFIKLIDNLDEKTQNMKAKIKIGEFIVHDLYKIRSDFYELATTVTNNKSRLAIKKRIDNDVETIRESLDILENGGTLERVIRLNIVGHNDTTKIITYKKLKHDVSLESIDLLPKLKQFSEMTDSLIELLKDQEQNRISDDYESFVKVNKEIKRFYKKTPPFFTRITENASRLLYEGSNELHNLEKEIEKQKKQYTKLELILIFTVLILVFIIGFIISLQINKNAKELERQERSTRGILDAQENIVVVSNGEYMIDANSALVDFFDDYLSFEDFSSKHICICDFFHDIGEKDYVLDIDYDGKLWFEYIIENSEKIHKVAMLKNGVINHFKINATKKYIDNKNFIVIITLNNITKEVSIQKEIEELNDNLENIVNEKTKALKNLNENLEQKVQIELKKNRKKDKALIQQGRFAAMGEMIANIAHQWRQPLSAISSTTTSMKLQMQLKIASDEDVLKSLDSISKYVDFLNSTIEDFRNFFKKDKEKTEFNILEIIKNSTSITSAVYKDNAIELITTYSKDDFRTKGFPNELSQVFLNIMNNAKDIFLEKKLEEKVVLIEVYDTKESNIIKIYDNAGGIEDSIIEKIFDPYFTTKHKSQGTGIGLYMSKEIIEKNMNGSLKAFNSTFVHDGKTHYGACFKIELPKI